MKGYSAVYIIKAATEKVGKFDSKALAAALHGAKISAKDNPGRAARRVRSTRTATSTARASSSRSSAASSKGLSQLFPQWARERDLAARGEHPTHAYRRVASRPRTPARNVAAMLARWYALRWIAGAFAIRRPTAVPTYPSPSLWPSLALVPLSTNAHHGWSEYDQTQMLTLTGTIEEMGTNIHMASSSSRAPGKTWIAVLAPPSCAWTTADCRRRC